jgi:putative DNA primase/helicase
MNKFDSIIPQLSRMFDTLSIKLIRLKGYSSANKKEGDERYSEAKTPIGKWGSATPLTEENAQEWVKVGGWLGLVIPEGYDVVDVDDRKEGELLRGLLKDQGFRFYEMRTKNGFQFFFKTSGRLKKQQARFVTAVGLVCDYRLAEKGYTVLPTEQTEGRGWVTSEPGTLDPTPFFLEPTPKRVTKPEDRSFTVPIQEGRNNTVHSWLCALVEFDLWNKE